MSHNNRAVQRYGNGHNAGDKRSRDNNFNSNHNQYRNNNDRTQGYSGGMPERRPPNSGGGGNFNHGTGGKGGKGGRGRGGGRGYQPREPLKMPDEVVVPEEVVMAKQLIVLLCNFTDESFDLAGVHSNLIEMAEALSDDEVGDLNKYATEIGDVFIKCFSQLSVQIPILCTLLSIIARQNSSFAARVVSMLFTEMIMSLRAGDVIVARNHLRSFACLTASRMIPLTSDNTDTAGSSFLQLLLSLVEIAEEENANTSAEHHSLSVSSQAATYLLAATVPFIASELHVCQSQGQDMDDVSSRISALCRIVAPNTADGVAHKSLYDCNNTHSVFHVNIEGTQSPNPSLDCFTRPLSAANEGTGQVHSSASSCPAGGSVCWDTLWETCRVADNILTAVHLTDGACYRYSEEKCGFDEEEEVDYLPKCMLLVWRNADIQARLDEPLAPVPEEGSTAAAVAVAVASASASLDPEEMVVEEPPKLVEAPKAQYTNYTLSPLLLIQNNTVTSSASAAIGAEITDVRSAVREAMMTAGFSAMAGPEADYYRQPSDRDKTLSNSSAGYAAWVGLRLNLFDEDAVDASVAASAVAAITKLSFLELAFVRDFFRSTLRFFEPFMRDNGTSVGSFDLLFKHLNSVKILFPAGVHLEYVLVETLLLMVVQVPPLNACLVQRVLLELCNRDAPVYAPVVAMGCNALFNLMPAMDVCAVRELSTLLSVYLTNRNRSWPYWSYWGDEYAEIVAAQDFDNAQKVFLDMLLDTLTRMSGFDQSPGDRMRAALPRSLHCAITADESLYTPECSLYDIDPATKSRLPFAQAVLNKLHSRMAPEELAAWLSTASDDAGLAGDDDGFRIRFLLQGMFVYVCQGASSAGGTISAVRNVVERYRAPLMQVVASSEDGGHILTECIVTCLYRQPALLNMFLDTVMRYGIMHPVDAASWLCRDLTECPSSGSPPVNTIHISKAATNHWVWTYVQTSVNRCLDMMKVAFAQRSVHVEAARSIASASSNGSAEVMEVDVPDAIAANVESAAEGCQEAYAVIVSNLLLHISARSQVLAGEDGGGAGEEIKELDGDLITAVSLVHQVLRSFHLTEAVFSTLAAANNTAVVSLTTKETVEALVEASLGSLQLSGVAAKIWRIFGTSQ